MIELAEEAFDGPVGQRLLAAMLEEVDLRYAELLTGLTQREVEAGDAAYRAEVTPEMVTRPRGAFVVARLDGAPVGCGAVRRWHGPLGVGEIKRMYTDPSARRLGVSRTVLARLEAIAVELGYHRLQLETGTPQPEAIELYTSAGWQPTQPYGPYKDAPTSRGFAKVLPS